MVWKEIKPLNVLQRLSLRLRLSVGVTAVVLATSIGLATVALHFVKRHMQESIAQEQFALLSALADAVDQKFISRRILLRNFAAGVQTHRFPEAAALQAFLVAHEKSLRESFDNVSFLDLKGDLVANLFPDGALRQVRRSVGPRREHAAHCQACLRLRKCLRPAVWQVFPFHLPREERLRRRRLRAPPEIDRTSPRRGCTTAQRQWLRDLDRDASLEITSDKQALKAHQRRMTEREVDAMQADGASRRQYWVIDPDPLARAQARHVPSG